MPKKRVRANGEGSVYARERTDAKGKTRTVWVVEVEYLDADRIVRRSTAQRSSKTEALRALYDLKMRARDDARPQVARDNRLVDEAVHAYLADVALRVDPSTVATYRTIIEGHLLPHLGRMRADALRRRHVVGWLTTLREAGVGERTSQVAYQRAKAILSPYVAHVAPAEHPFPTRGGPKVAEPEVRAWSDEQMRTFVGGMVGQPHEAALLLGLLGGLRQGEVRGLRWGDVDLKAGAIRIVRSLSRATRAVKAPKTASGIRTIHLPPEGRDALVRHHAAQMKADLPIGPDDFVFGTSRRSVSSAPALYHGLQREIVRLNLPRISYHALRHTFATSLLAGGANPKVVQHVLGHADPTLLLRRYGHVIPGAEAEVADRLAAILSFRSGSKSGSQKNSKTKNRQKSKTLRHPTNLPAPRPKTITKPDKKKKTPR